MLNIIISSLLITSTLFAQSSNDPLKKYQKHSIILSEELKKDIVKDMQKNLPHAILIVYTESGPMVLDNQIKRMTPSREVSHYKPIFSINRTAWWLHTDTERNPTQIASAAN